MNWRAIRAIVRKDWKVVFQNKGVTIPMIVVPVMILGALPGLAALVPSLSAMPGWSLNELDPFLAHMPPGLQAELAGYNGEQLVVVAMLVYFLAPMYLILPLMVASVVAAGSFAGEVERKTMEALIYTPTTDREIFLAKMLVAWLPAIAVAWGGFVLYSVMTNLAAWRVMGRVFFPNAMWLVLALWVAPAVAGLGLGVTVIVSARAKSFQEASQLAGVIVLPIIMLVIGQATGVMYFSVGLVALLGLVCWFMDAALLRYGGRAFKRSEVITRL